MVRPDRIGPHRVAFEKNKKKDIQDPERLWNLWKACRLQA